jgi:hypothetical protein
MPRSTPYSGILMIVRHTGVGSAGRVRWFTTKKILACLLPAMTLLTTSALLRPRATAMRVKRDSTPLKAAG